jgi:hypothetical protein
VSEQLSRPVLTHSDLRRAKAAASAIDDAHEALERYVAVRNVVMYALTASTVSESE